MLRYLSVAAFFLMVAGIIGLYDAHAIFARRPAFIAVQAAAVALMIAARIAFGRRSFHPAANPTAGGLVTTGPYTYLRHPIYAAVLYFSWAGTLDNFSRRAILSALLISAGALVRMVSEERLLLERYPEYRDYMARVRRVVPFLI